MGRKSQAKPVGGEERRGKKETGTVLATDGWLAMPNLEAHSGRFTAYWPGVKSSQKLREATGTQLSALLSPKVLGPPPFGFSTQFFPGFYSCVQKLNFWLRLVLAVSIVLVLVLRSREFISIISFGT